MGGGGRSAAVTCTILLLCLAARVSGSSNVTAAEAETPHTLTCFLAASQCPKDAATLGSLLGRQAAAASGNQQNSSGYASLSKVESKYVHRHKKLSPVEWQDVVGFVAVAASLVLAASGGVGGGGLLIPIFMLIMGFRTVTAVALSNVTIVGGTLTNFAFNVGRRHPLRPGPLVDWDLILVMEPSTILGALAGGYINHILPAWLTTISLGLLLFFVTYSLTRRALAAYRKETLQIHRALANHNSPTKKDGRASDSSDEEAQYPLPAPAAPIDIPTPNSPSQDGLLAGVAVTGQQDVPDPLGPETPTSVLQPGGFISPETANQLSEPLLGPGPQQPSGRDSRGFNFFKKRFSRQWTPEVPLGKFLLLVALLAGVAVSDTIRSNLRCPSTGYWLAAVSMAPVTLVVLFLVREYLIRKHHSQHSERVYIHAEGDIAWTAKTTIVYPALCTFAGVAAGLFGVGGGIIKGPLMLSMGVHPQVAAATSATMILFTSAAASTVFISFGAVMWDYAAVLFTLALIFTAIGQLATRSIVRRMHGRSSIIVFAMAATLGCSAAVLGVQGVIAGWEAIRRHEAWQFGTVCTAAPA